MRAKGVGVAIPVIVVFMGWVSPDYQTAFWGSLLWILFIIALELAELSDFLRGDKRERSVNSEPQAK